MSSDSTTNTNETPEHFLCPLTMEVMNVPLTHKKTGKTFEREAINSWMFMEFKNTCPLTRKPICPADFVENRALRLQIIKWKQQNQLVNAKADESDEDDEADDDELFQQVVANATKIGNIAKSHKRQQRQKQQIKEEEDSYRHLMGLGLNSCDKGTKS